MLSAVDLARRIESGELTPRTVIERCAEAIASAEVQIGASTVNPAQVGLLLIDASGRGDSAVAKALTAAGIDSEYRRADVPRPDWTPEPRPVRPRQDLRSPIGRSPTLPR